MRRRGSVPLGEVGVLATEPTGYRTLRDRLLDSPKAQRKKYWRLLRNTLDRVASPYDVALIDFPGSEIPLWTLMGLQAADYWLLPEIPDYFSAAAIEGVTQLVEQVRETTGHQVRPLGTLLTICPNRGSSVYKKTRRRRGISKNSGAIPRLFPKDTEILHRPDAQKAIDWERSGSRRFPGGTVRARHRFMPGSDSLLVKCWPGSAAGRQGQTFVPGRPPSPND